MFLCDCYVKFWGMGIQVYHVTISEVEKRSGLYNQIWNKLFDLIHYQNLYIHNMLIMMTTWHDHYWTCEANGGIEYYLLEGSLKRFIHSSLETSTHHHNTLVQCYFNHQSAAMAVFHHTLLAKDPVTWNSNSFHF